MQKYLVIVESPTKAKTISKFLGKEYRVESSFGHVRDLPKSELGVDVEHDFAPRYVVPRANTKRVNALKKLTKDVDIVYFATDEDREGEAISWHLKEVCKVPDEKSKRIAFHEITETAIFHALEHPRNIDVHLVDAQQARRILDRLVGYELSPFLWRKIAKGLSAGRVQSVALRLVVEREREIQQFVAQEYWSIEIDVSKKDVDTKPFRAKLYKRSGVVLDKFSLTHKEAADSIVSQLTGASYHVVDSVKKKTKKTPPPPFITSTLQQEANRKLRFSAKQTMMIAQQLYEGIDTGKGSEGLITYMRTDSVNMAEKFLDEAKSFIQHVYGGEYATGPRRYTTKAKLAQEAHEAIRPTSPQTIPSHVKEYLTEQQYRLYDLIWRRAIGSQMADAEYEATIVDIFASKQAGEEFLFRSSGQVVLFDGFTKVYSIESEEILLPRLTKDEELELHTLEGIQHSTKPPARYSEAGLVKVLESHGIGRPSTYAPTISTLIARNYVQREERRLKPTEIAFLVNDLLVAHFPQIVDYAFTAHMESGLDAIATGDKQLAPVIREFYTPFKEQLVKKDSELKKKDIIAEETDIVCEKCGKAMIIKIGRYGKFIACSGFPECKNTKQLPVEGETGGESVVYEPCEKCGGEMVLKRGRFGSFLGCSAYPECKHIRSLDEKKLGIPCPKCGTGEIIQKRTRRKKIFYPCNRYPDCDYSSWTPPEKEK